MADLKLRSVAQRLCATNCEETENIFFEEGHSRYGEKRCKNCKGFVQELIAPDDKIKFSFGKYKGERVLHIINIDKNYINWLLDQSWVADTYPNIYLAIDRLYEP